jgi:hypothetical protein
MVSGSRRRWRRRSSTSPWVGRSSSQARSRPHSSAKAVLWYDSRRVWLKIATASAMWFRVSSWASTCFLKASRTSSISVTSAQNTPTPPPSSGWADRRNARRRPSRLIQRSASRRPLLGALLDGLDHQGVGAAVEALAGQGLGRVRGRADGADEGAVAPDGLAVGAGDPAGLGHAVDQRRETRRGRQAGLIAADGRQPQPGQRPGRAAFDRRRQPWAPRASNDAGLAALEQRGQLLGVIGIGLVQRGHHRLDIGRDAQGLGAGRQALAARHEAGPAALDGHHGGVEGLDPAGCVQGRRHPAARSAAPSAPRCGPRSHGAGPATTR